MTSGVRAIAWAIVVIGVLLGGRGQGPQREPLRHGEDLVLAVDFHVHSFPGDGSLAPWDLAIEARRRGLDAIALTNHNHRLQWTLTQALRFTPDGALLIPGEELTSVGYHLAVAGTERTVAWRQSAADAGARIHDEGGIAIAAHPAGKETTGFDDRAIDVVDGVEVAHPLIYVFADGRRDLAQFYARARARRPHIAAIGSTDYHVFAPVGYCRTFVFARERSVAAIIEAVRRGATVACDATGTTYGPADLSAAVADACRAAAGAPPLAATSIDAAGMWLAWSGLLALVLLGARETIA
jgi:predicted metal-dependent phosphoesterase TrpH